MTLNRNQLVALWAGILVGVLALLFPVCDNKATYVGESDFSAAHVYLFESPLPPLDLWRTSLECLIIGCLTAGAIISLKHALPRTRSAEKTEAVAEPDAV
jgi:hypothetical protein